VGREVPVTVRVVTFALVILLLLPGLLAAEARKSVLLVFDEDKDFPGLAIVNRSLRETFRSELKSDVEFYSESLNLSQFRDQGHDVVFVDGVAVFVRPITGAMAETAIGGQRVAYVPK
jgi:hypothetical protein